MLYWRKPVDSELYEELLEITDHLSEYYSDITGRNIALGMKEDEIWIDSTRTNGREFFDSLEEAERRLKLLYDDLLPDEDEADPLEGF
jgi:hypothetical protein